MEFSPTKARTGQEILLPFIELDLRDTSSNLTTHRWGGVPIVAAEGYIKGLITKFGPIRFALSDDSGQYQATTFSWTVSDKNLVITNILDSITSRHLINQQVSLLIYEDAQRRAGLTPFVLCRGAVNDYSGEEGRLYTFTATDYITSEVGMMKSELKVPRRLIDRGIFEDCPLNLVGLPEPIMYGELIATADVTERIPVVAGRVPIINVGTQLINGVTWRRNLVAGHACHSLVNIWSGGVTINDRAGLDGDILAPGFAGWEQAFGEGVPRYYDIRDRRYTLIFTKGNYADDTFLSATPITLDLRGVEDVGDCTGNLITEIPKQLRHFLKNFGLQNWLLGPWLSAPVSPYGGHALIDEASFDTLAADLLAATGETWTGSIVIGAGGEHTSLREQVARFVRSCACFDGFDLNGAFFVSLDHLPVNPVAIYTPNDIIGDGPTPIFLHDKHHNQVPIHFSRDWVGNAWLSSYEAFNQDSISRYRTTKNAASTEFWAIDSQIKGRKAAGLILKRRLDPPQAYNITLPIYVLQQVKAGSVIGLTDPDLGWVERNFQVVELSIDPETFMVGMLIIDLDSRVVNPVVDLRTIAERAQATTYSYGSTTGGTVVVSTSGGRTYPLGGDRVYGVQSSTWAPAPNAMTVYLNGAEFEGRIKTAVVHVRCKSVSGSVTPRVLNIRTGMEAGRGEIVVGNAWVTRWIALSLTGQEDPYIFQLLPSSGVEEVYGQGYVEIK